MSHVVWWNKFQCIESTYRIPSMSKALQIQLPPHGEKYPAIDVTELFFPPNKEKYNIQNHSLLYRVCV